MSAHGQRHLRMAEPDEQQPPPPTPKTHLRGAELDKALADALERLACGPHASNDDALVPWSLRDFLA